MSLFKKSLLVATLCISAPLAAQDVNLEVMNKIRAEGYNNSQVLETLEYLSDNIGPRLTGSPAMKQANDWTAEKLTGWGLKNAHLEGLEFGRGWTYQDVGIHMTAPRQQQIQGYPVSWHPSTDGVLEGEVVHINSTSKAELDKYKGKLKGKIVALGKMAKINKPKGEAVKRLSDDDLAELKKYKDVSPNLLGYISQMLQGWLMPGYNAGVFLEAEGALAVVEPSARSGGIFDASGYGHREGFTPKLPSVKIAPESYNRMLRLMEDGEAVRLSVDVKATYHDNDSKSYNTIAEIPGKGRNPEIVMAGAHLDSWFLGDGSMDNGAGVAVVMEAVRILKAIGVEPKRTIRVGLWTGEEQGLLGSRAYIQKHFAARADATGPMPAGTLPLEHKDPTSPFKTLPDHARLSAYFNLDNGSGRIRGVYTEGNMEAQKIFDDWLKPFHNLGAETTTAQGTGGTDHLSFQYVGLPGYQFIQDRLDYSTRLHHTQLDVLDNANEDDMKQASVIMAAFLYNAAMREDRMPRKAMPK